MPTKNVYVSDDDAALFAEAGKLAGSFSAAVVEALRDYVKKRRQASDGFEEIELELREDGVRRRVSFTGRCLVKIRRPDALGTRIDTVYLTAKNQFAVVTKVLPDWAFSQSYSWSNPEIWGSDFRGMGNKTLQVYSDMEQLRRADAFAADKVEKALAVPACEVLDI